MSAVSKSPGIPSLRDMCLYPVVQQKLAAGARVDFSDLHFPLNLEASEMIEKFYERFRKEDGSIDRIKVIRAMAGDFNSLLDPRIYHFVMKELLSLDISFWSISSFMELDELVLIPLSFMHDMSIYRNDGLYKIIENIFLEATEGTEINEELRQDFANKCAVIRGIKNETIDLANYDIENELGKLVLPIVFMKKEQIMILLRRDDLNQDMINSIYYGVVLNGNNHQLIMELIRDEQIGTPDAEGIKKIFLVLAGCDKVRTISFLFENLPINLRPNQEEINEIFQGACDAGRVNVVRYFIEEAPVGLRPNQEGINEAITNQALDRNVEVIRYLLVEAPIERRWIDQASLNQMTLRAAKAGNLEVVLYLLAGTFEGIRTNVTINALIFTAANWSKVNVVKYFLEERAQEITKIELLMSRILQIVYSNYRYSYMPGLGAPPSMEVVKYLMEEAPINLRPNKATILLMYNQASLECSFTQYLREAFSLQEKILLQTCKIFKGFRHLANKLF